MFDIFNPKLTMTVSELPRHDQELQKSPADLEKEFTDILHSCLVIQERKNRKKYSICNGAIFEVTVHPDDNQTDEKQTTKLVNSGIRIAVYSILNQNKIQDVSIYDNTYGPRKKYKTNPLYLNGEKSYQLLAPGNIVELDIMVPHLCDDGNINIMAYRHVCEFTLDQNDSPSFKKIMDQDRITKLYRNLAVEPYNDQLMSYLTKENISPSGYWFVPNGVHIDEYTRRNYLNYIDVILSKSNFDTNVKENSDLLDRLAAMAIETPVYLWKQALCYAYEHVQRKNITPEILECVTDVETPRFYTNKEVPVGAFDREKAAYGKLSIGIGTNKLDILLGTTWDIEKQKYMNIRMFYRRQHQGDNFNKLQIPTINQFAEEAEANVDCEDMNRDDN